MGLLEKAGKISEEGKAKPKAKAKAKKKESPKKAAAKPKQSKKSEAKEPKKAKVRKPRSPREPRVMPDGFDLARPAAKGARNLVDFIVNYGGIVALIAFTATGAFFDPTIMLLGALLPIILNMFVLPYKFNRTVGMFLTRTRYVNSRGNHPNFTHQMFSSLTPFLVMGGVVGLFMGFGNDETGALVGGIILLSVVLIDYVVTRIRHANDQSQNMWDAMYGCWFVVAERSEGDSKWSARLEALGDWGEKRGWGAASNDDESDADDS